MKVLCQLDNAKETSLPVPVAIDVALLEAMRRTSKSGANLVLLDSISA